MRRTSSTHMFQNNSTLQCFERNMQLNVFSMSLSKVAVVYCGPILRSYIPEKRLFVIISVHYNCSVKQRTSLPTCFKTSRFYNALKEIYNSSFSQCSFPKSRSYRKLSKILPSVIILVRYNCRVLEDDIKEGFHVFQTNRFYNALKEKADKQELAFAP